ncbi:organic solute transporter subunit beta [Rana temporaria]|uniref:organic solute transporter subunit beta n=1 Tax=Rana temporaria TaxID=8407 RepID=UPI001AACFAD3|nr:organic solute transporter subunit beta [Rana temporaria]XP_040198231.1 organic solute transporter subunit beta [Rana temporaria]
MVEANQNNPAITAMSEEQKKMQKAIYFFRTGDLTVWNYVVLALAFFGLFLGLFLLSKNILNNRKRKMMALYETKTSDKQPEEAEEKQAVVTLEKEDSPDEHTALKKEPQPGDIEVQWRDGQITSLFRHMSEEDV